MDCLKKISIELEHPIDKPRGYWNRPDATADAFTEDGWFRTGDVGGFNELGLLSIKGRIKEIIVTSTGEKVPPADLESAITSDRLFSQ